MVDCGSVSDAMAVFAEGTRNRKVGSHLLNKDSSRSHSIYTITVESCEKRPDGSSGIRMGKLNLVDLAGSENTRTASSSLAI